MRLHGLPVLALVAMAVGCDSDSPSRETPVSSKYQPGQVWTYHNRQGEDKSRLTILHLDADPKLGTIVHVAIADVSIKNPQAPGGASTEIQHLPFSEEAVDRSVLEQVGTRPLPDFQEGYDDWREAFDHGQGGIWTITAAEAIDAMEQAMNQGQ